MGCKGHTNGAAIAAAFAACLLSSAASASDCRSITDGTERLKCYDKQTGEATTEQKTPASNEVRTVDASDLVVGSRKYLNREISINRVRCYFADVDDYRCMPSDGALLIIFSKKIEPKEARDYIEQRCDTLKKVTSDRACVMNVRLHYGEDETSDDIISGYQTRRVIRPKDGISVVTDPNISKKSRR